ncbi:glycosyltransferase [Sphingomonas arenae]|uniref:glycosyltransferase n=1 Tax=Sphingomonas arenae TaxID=2812555 RepID=UPI001F3D327B|nr:glycosyltransferase family A protein [Sphingomonas arenae]
MAMSTNARNGTLGVVVIGRNEGTRLERALRAILPHTNKVVYADSGSSDGSPDVARTLGVFVIELDDSAAHTAARGRREGVSVLLERHPECEFVQFVDGDCIVDPQWIGAALAFLDSNPSVAAVCGRRREQSPLASAYNHLCDDEWNTPVGEAEACGGDAMMRVRALQEVGGFRADLRAGEEPELCSRLRRAGWKVWRLDAPMTEHDAAIHRFGQWWRRALRGGFGYAQVHQVTTVAGTPLYRRQLQSAALWVAGIPLASVLLALLTSQSLLLLAPVLLWALQIARIAVRRGPSSAWSWQSAALLMIAKVPELIGAIRFILQRERSGALEYKAAR